MPVGTAIGIATDDGAIFEATVTEVHEQVGGSNAVAGMIVRPRLDVDAARSWWKSKVELPDVVKPEPAPVIGIVRSKRALEHRRGARARRRRSQYRGRSRRSDPDKLGEPADKDTQLIPVVADRWARPGSSTTASARSRWTRSISPRSGSMPRRRAARSRPRAATATATTATVTSKPESKSGPTQRQQEEAQAPVSAIIPPRIARGQTLGIVAPAGPVKLELLRAGLARLGDAFELRLAPSLTAPRDAGVAELSRGQRRRPRGRADGDDRGSRHPRDPARARRLRADADPATARSGRLARAIRNRSSASPTRPRCSRGHTPPGCAGSTARSASSSSDSREPDVAHLIALLTEARAPGVRPWSLGSRTVAGSHRGPLFAANLTLVSLLVGTPVGAAARRRDRLARGGRRATRTSSIAT